MRTDGLQVAGQHDALKAAARMEGVVGHEGAVGIGKIDLAELPAEVAQLAEVGIALHGKAAGEGDALGIGFLPGLELVHALGGLGHA